MLVYHFQKYIVTTVLAVYVAAFLMPCSGWAQHTGPSVNLPMGHFGYDLIEHLETRGVVSPSICLRTKPYDRGTVLKIINEVQDKIKTDANVLTSAERSLFEKLKGEFYLELASTQNIQTSDVREKHIFEYQMHEDGFSYLVGDLVIDQSVELTRFSKQNDSLGGTIGLSKGSGRVRGLIKGGIAFYADASNTLVKGDEQSTDFGSRYRGGVLNYNPASANRYALHSDAYIVIEPKWFRLQVGKDNMAWGPGYYDNLLLSGHAPSFENIKLDVSYSRFKFTYVHGWLRDDRDTVNGRKDLSDRKYIVAHRLEWKVLPWLFLAGSESVIYGGRDVELSYLNPLVPYHVAEQYLGDKDNNTMSFDVLAFLPGRTKVYGAVYLDDFTSARNPFTYWKQTWAVMGGGYWAEPIGIQDAGVRIEYSRIEPFVYAHKWRLLNYTHFDAGLGSQLQPNSDRWNFSISYQPSRRLRAEVGFRRIRHGEGDIQRFGYEYGFTDDDSGKQKKRFLMGIKEIRNSALFNTSFETWSHHALYLQYELSMIQNLGNRKGFDATQNYLRIGYTLDY